VKCFFLLGLAVGGCHGGSPTSEPTVPPARSEALARVVSATAIVRGMRADADGAIPLAIARSARCVAVVPALVHAGLFIGARAGRGVVTCRERESWTKPAFFVLSGASAGLMGGVQSVDLVMLIMTDLGETSLLEGKMQVGADTSVAAGPVGRTAQAASDVTLRATVIYYSRARGLFVGLDLAGTVLEPDEESSRAFYGDTRDFGALLRGEKRLPPAVAAFRDEVERSFPRGHAGD
jgi:SH3 domain-containing YSC84-like protein 1